MTAAIASPLAGWATPLGEVPDPVFADRMLGDGVAIDPVEGRLVAPGAGIVLSVHPAGHAVTLALDTGPVLLMHIGLETVGLGGAGFAPKVADGARVAAGDLLVEFDLDRLARTAKSLVTPVIVTNGDAFAVEAPVANRAVTMGETLMTVRATDGTAATIAAAGPHWARRRHDTHEREGTCRAIHRAICASSRGTRSRPRRSWSCSRSPRSASRSTRTSMRSTWAASTSWSPTARSGSRSRTRRSSPTP